MNSLSLLSTELGLIALSLVVLVSELVLPSAPNRSERTNRVARQWSGHITGFGLTLLFCHLITRNGHWGSGFFGMFRFDELAWYLKCIFLLSGMATVLLTQRYSRRFTRGLSEFYLLMLYSLLGMLTLASVSDLLMLFVGIELVTFSLYIMTAYLRTDTKSIEAGLKYLVLGALSASFLLFGIAFTYGFTGSTQFGLIQAVIANSPELQPGLRFGLLMIFSGLAFKIAIVPFHIWVPDVYEGAPTPVTAFLAMGSKAAGIAALLRVAGELMAPAWPVWMPLFAILAAITMSYGNLSAIPQTNVKRLLGYSSIGHAGYLLMGLTAGTPAGAAGVGFYLAAYILTTACAFFVVQLVANRSNDNYHLDTYNGLARRSPQLAATMFVALLSLAGVPPLVGFFGKFLLFKAVVDQGLIWLAIVGSLNVIVSMYYYLLVVKRMYLHDADGQMSPLSLTGNARVLLYSLSIAMIVLGIVPSPLLRLAQTAIQTLF